MAQSPPRPAAAAAEHVDLGGGCPADMNLLGCIIELILLGANINASVS